MGQIQKPRNLPTQQGAKKQKEDIDALKKNFEIRNAFGNQASEIRNAFGNQASEMDVEDAGMCHILWSSLPVYYVSSPFLFCKSLLTTSVSSHIAYEFI